jgi:hypothetical protein
MTSRQAFPQLPNRFFISKTPLGDIVVVPIENEASLRRPEAPSQNVIKRVKVPATASARDAAWATTRFVSHSLSHGYYNKSMPSRDVTESG